MESLVSSKTFLFAHVWCDDVMPRHVGMSTIILKPRDLKKFQNPPSPRDLEHSEREKRLEKERGDISKRDKEGGENWNLRNFGICPYLRA